MACLRSTTVAALCFVLLAVASSAQQRFLFWSDYPGSSEFNVRNGVLCWLCTVWVGGSPVWPQKTHPHWWDLISVRNGTSFKSSDGVSVEVNWDDHKVVLCHTLDYVSPCASHGRCS